MPDSISSVAPTRCCRRRPPVRTRKKTAAASVEAMMVPSSSALHRVEVEAQARPAAPATVAVMSDAERGEQQRRRQNAAEDREARAKPAVEEDDRERDHADEVGDGIVAEVDAARAVLAGEHSDDEEDEEQRRAGAGGDEAGENADHDERRADEDRGVDKIEAVQGGGPPFGRGDGMRMTMASRRHRRGKDRGGTPGRRERRRQCAAAPRSPPRPAPRDPRCAPRGWSRSGRRC